MNSTLLSQMVWMSVKWLYFNNNNAFSTCICILNHNIYLHLNFNKWHNNALFYFIYILIFLWSLLILLLLSFLGVSLILLLVLLLLLRLVTGNVVMVATDMCGKSPYGSLYTELRESMTFLPFLFSFLIVNFHNFGYIFTLHHYSAVCWDFILRLICLDTCIIFLFFSVVILFIYDSDRYGTAATSGKELFMINIYGFQSLLCEIGGFVWDVLAVPDPPLVIYSFSINNIIVCSKVSFSKGLCCRETSQLTDVCWCLYDTHGCWKILLSRL